MKNRKKEESRKFPFLLLIAIGVFVSFMLSFFLGENGILRLRQLNAEYERERLENYRVAKENRQLVVEIHKLKNEPATVEKIAREELHMVAPDDTVLIVPQKTVDSR